MRTVLLCYGHPDYSIGGAEMASYSLYRALAAEDPDNVHLISWISSQRAQLHGPGAITRLRANANEWLYHAEPASWLYQASASRDYVYRDLVTFLVSLEPDVVHFHHFMGFGLDAIRLVRLALPHARIVLTIHEFLAICANDGQMVTRPAGKLCETASPVRCSGCFPDVSRSQFALREIWFKRHLDFVDLILSPSQFLKSRYVAWGLDPDRIQVIENAQHCTTRTRPDAAGNGTDLASTFAFFGQLNPYKGINVLLDAVRSLDQRLRRAKSELTPRILLYGPMVGSEEFQSRLSDRIAAMSDMVEYRGAYDMSEVVTLMSSAGWIVLPSTWWENSPVVIEEAFYAGRPIICANIGGMKEKVAHEVNGLHFRARDPVDLSAVMERCLREPDLWPRLKASVREVPSLAASATAHRACYEGLGHG